jgi:hypothetical protein
MWEEPALAQSSLFGFAEISSSDGCLGLTEVARHKLGYCDELFVVMATGVSGRGKSARLTGLIRPDLKRLPRRGEDLFRSGDGPNPVTGLARDGIDFPCFGPVRLSHFCKNWGIPTQPGDEKIALVFVDSQGTKSLEDSGQHRALELMAVTIALGLRLCVTNWSRPSKLDINDIMGCLKMNLLLKTANGNVCPYAVAVMHPDVYQPATEGWNAQIRQAHEEEKRRDNKDCKARWQREQSKLKMEDFNVWLMDSPMADFQGYWNAMRELSEWIAQLARRRKRSFKAIDTFMSSVCTYVRELRKQFPDFTDDTDIDAGELLKIWLSMQWIQKGEEVIKAGERAVEMRIEKATIDEIMKAHLQDFIRDQYQETLQKLNQLGESLIVGYRNEISDDVRRIETSVEMRLQICVKETFARRERIILNDVETAIEDGMMAILRIAIENCMSDIGQRPLAEMLISQFDDHLVEEGQRKLEVEINKNFQKFCLGSREVQNDGRIKKIAAEKLHLAKIALDAEIRRCFAIYRDEAHQRQIINERDKATEEIRKRDAEHKALIQAQEESAKRALAAEQAKAKREAEVARKALEEKEVRLREEKKRQEEQIKKMEEEQRQSAMKMKQKHDEFVEQMRKQREEEERLREEKARKAAAEQQRILAEMKRHQENLEKQLREEAERRRREEEEKRRREEENRRRQEEERRRREEENRKRQEAERRRREEEWRRQEAERRRREEEWRRQEAERLRREEEERRRVREGVNVRVRQGANVYGRPYQYDSWVYGAVFELRELIGDRGVIYHNGGCTGPVHVNDLTVA